MTERDKELERLEAAASAPPAATRIPVDKGHFGIDIDVDGVWSHGGLPFPRLALAKLFATVLKRDAEGVYWLETPVERGRIDVADAPFIAVELEAEGAGPDQRICFRTNLDAWAPLDAGHPLRVEIDGDTDEPRPYIAVREGLEARLARSVFYELVDLAEEEAVDGMLGVWSHGAYHILGPAEDDGDGEAAP
jgi:hypothetical protein